jgi:4-hydroxy-3-methylbut-2-enyl diphosphate reductase
VRRFTDQGVVFVDSIDQVPQGATVVYSAHGVSPEVRRQAQERNLVQVDATCPLVAKVHREGQRYAEKGFDVILIGHEGHPEVEGTRGRIPGGVHLVQSIADVDKLKVRDPNRVAYITQTTLSVDDTRVIIDRLKERFPNVNGPDVRDICYATQNRQQAVRLLGRHVDIILVVGSSNSSNSNRLREIGTEMNVPSYLIDQADDVDPAWLKGVKAVGLTAGASAPEELVQQVIARLGEFGPIEVQNLEGVEENVRFKLPEMLWDVAESPYGTTHKYSRRESSAAQ